MDSQKMGKPLSPNIDTAIESGFFNWLSKPSKKITFPAMRRKAQLLSIFVVFLFLLFLIINLIYLATVPGYKFPPADLIGYGFLAVIYVLSRSRFLNLGIFLMLVMFPMNVFQNVLSGTSINVVATLSYLLPSYILASIFLNLTWTAIYGYGLNLVVLLLPALAPKSVPGYMEIQGFLSVSMVVVTLCIIWIIYRNKIERDHQTTLKMAYDGTLEGWSHALEIRDKETQGHSKRVTDLALKLGSTLGLHDEELDNLYRGALLHDIGKMAIPDSVLLKTSVLNSDERKLMQTHPKIAYDMLSKISFLEPALVIPAYHHEWWNGEGYPYGLRGEQIPIAARIFAIVDVWDALLSDRPYRKAWSKEAALAYLNEQKGRQFDPRVVDAFLSL
jgi:putative nucleotidyltransferase with HDIG domain